MSKANMSFGKTIRQYAIPVGVLFVWFLTMAGMAQSPVPKPPEAKAQSAVDAEVKALIEKLVARDPGKSNAIKADLISPGLHMFSCPAKDIIPDAKTSSLFETIRSLIRLGPKALPQLIEHLGDERPTSIILGNEFGFMGVITVKEDKIGKDQKSDMQFNLGSFIDKYTITIGDLSYIIIGSIVNRPFLPITYQPTWNYIVQSIPRSKTIRDEVRKNWSNLDTEKHKNSLVGDLASNALFEYQISGALGSLAFFYPDDMESILIKELTRPVYNSPKVESFIQNSLFPASTPRERKELVETFITKEGEEAREGIRWELFGIFDPRDEDEYYDRELKQKQKNQAKECLVQLFGYPASVTGKDRPKTQPLDEIIYSYVIEKCDFVESKKLDQALIRIMGQTQSDKIAWDCIRVLNGRGYDAEIQAYHKSLVKKIEVDKNWNLPVQKVLGQTRLHAAMAHSSPFLMKRALQKGIAIDAQGLDGQTALHLAAEDGDGELVKDLLEAKANPNLPDKSGLLPVQLAARNEYANIVRFLLQNKSEVPDVLVASIAGDNNRIDEAYKKSPKSVHSITARSYTPLHIATNDGNLAMVRKLIKLGADVNAAGGDRPDGGKAEGSKTPLHLAVEHNQFPIAAELLAHGANVNAQSLQDGTPLHQAVSPRNLRLIKLLLDYKADPRALNRQHKTPRELLSFSDDLFHWNPFVDLLSSYKTRDLISFIYYESLSFFNKFEPLNLVNRLEWYAILRLLEK